jgi:DNA-binding FadR family transcriptional regulator
MQIITGQRKSGEFLPSEAEMLAQFKVSRPILREALRILEVESLIALGRGARSGAAVLAPSVERSATYASMVLVSNGATISELHQARTLTEPSIAAYLAKDSRHKQFAAQMQQQVDSANEAIAAEDYQAALYRISEFHTVLVKQSGNKPLILQAEVNNLLIRKTGDILLEVSGKQDGTLRQSLTKTTANHQKLVDLIREGKAPEAEDFWRRYMVRGQSFLDKNGMGARAITYHNAE